MKTFEHRVYQNVKGCGHSSSEMTGTGHPGGIRESGQCNEAREIASYAVMVGGYYAEGATDFYTTAERRGTAMKRAYFLIKHRP